MTPARSTARARRGRHRAPVPLLRRVAPPAVLLAAVALGIGGLAVTGPPSATISSVSALGVADQVPVAAPSEIESLRVAPPRAVTAAPIRPPARASRSRQQLIWARPVGGHLTSRFGWRWGRAHRGVDIGATYGSPVRAAGAGVVVSAGWAGGYGNLVTIRHKDGTITAYAHMSAIVVHPGSVVAGQQIGRVGSTGRSTGPHLHFEVRRGGGQVNPLQWLSSRGIGL